MAARRSFRVKAEATGSERVTAEASATSPVASAFRRKEETVEGWLTRHGQRGRLRAWLWEPLAVAALNQSPVEAPAGPFVNVLAEMFRPSRSHPSLVLPLSLVASRADALVGADNATLVALAAREVAASIPGARDAVLKRGTVIREKRATFSLAPGQPARPGVGTPVEGLVLAGDWIETGF